MFSNWQLLEKQVFRNIFVSSGGEKKREEALEIQRFLAAINTTPSSRVCVEMKELQNARGEKFSSLTQRVQGFSLPAKLKERGGEAKTSQSSGILQQYFQFEEHRERAKFCVFVFRLSKDLQRGKFVMLLQLRRDAVWSILPEYLSYGQRSSLEKNLFHLYVEYLERKENELRNSLL